MIRHMLLFELRKDIAPEKAEQILAALREFPAKFPAMRRFSLGRNISRRDDTFSYAMTLEFDSLKDLESYLGSEYHERFVDVVFRPNVQRRAIATLEVEQP